MTELNEAKIMNSHSFNYIKNQEAKKNDAAEEQNLLTTQKRGQPKININRLPPAFANQNKRKHVEPLIIKKEQKQQVQQNIHNIEAMQEYKQVSQMLSPLKALIIHQILA
ncbi:unnamed protein product (macronuclear) [Paramecium tetraurelia]|uniref:Uncharacterized protein n=1 Tax=Paramecium tetraurelia TaxID=5888 RepID=A0BFZ9_PARTE|nr:uncharacterized protein GSPATT00028501001 [Paramecium tetraurelia]CAK57466.1 unnamed protein product [Paramecium tetraurelia]|eukprot:XP_001424864.1 hypothetical protein (macronuclear) [Paramecium tetraurelia strain d4-2]